METARLQSLWIRSRDLDQPSFAKNEFTRRSVGDDGILYQLLDQADQTKYRLLTSDQEAANLRRSHEIAATITKRNAAPSKLSQKGVKYVPPVFGTASKANRIFMNKAQPKVPVSKEDGSRKLSASKSTTNQAQPESERIEVRNPSSISLINARMQEVRQSQYNESKSALDNATNLIQTKYFENLEVVNQLYHEKKEMEARLRRLEQDRGYSSQYDGYGAVDSSGANLYGSDDDDDIFPREVDRGDTRSAPVRSSTSPSRMRQSPRGRSADRGSAGSFRRSLSATRFSISADLQADIDRYEHKQRLLKEKEEISKQQELEYSLRAKERSLRASLVSEDQVKSHVKNLEDSYRLQLEKSKFRREKQALKDWIREEEEEKERLLKLKEHKELEEKLYNPPENPVKIWERELPRRPKSAPSATRGVMISKTTEFSKFPDKMKLRHDRVNEVREKRLLHMKQSEEELKAKIAMEEKMKMEKLFNSRLPESGRRLTKTVETRADLVKSRMKKENDDALRRKRIAERREKRMHETAINLKTAIEIREEARKRELNVEGKSTAQKIREKREELQLRREALKSRIDNKLKKHPSLIEQYERDLERTKAHISAVQKAASVIPVRDDFDDLFSGKEKHLIQRR